MVLHPDVQRKAQEEIDRVVDTDRLPNFGDRPNLPYVEAVLSEATRWIPVSALGFPHTTTADGTYNGMYIPKGVVIIPNVWYVNFVATHHPYHFLQGHGSRSGALP